MKRVLIVATVVMGVIAAAGFVWARTVFGGDGVRVALAGQISRAIGQPVSIGSISARALPRVTVSLRDVRIGGGSNAVRLADLQIGTDFRALLSRRIEHATLRLNGAEIALPLPPLIGLTAPSPETTGPSPVELVSVDEVVLANVRITSGGRTLTGDIDLVPRGTTAVSVRRIQLGAGDATITATGEISSIAGPVGTINLKTASLNVDELLAFAQAFAEGSGLATSSHAPGAGSQPRAASPPSASAMDLTFTLDAPKAAMGRLLVNGLNGRARITADGVALDPISFELFGGTYSGAVTMSLDQVPRIRARATLAGLDVAAATAFAGSPDTMTGRLSGRLDVQARGTNPSSLTNSAAGTLRADVTDGIVRNLGMLHAVVIATSMRTGAMENAAGASRDEPFSRLGATFALGGGIARTTDLLFASKDFDLHAQGDLNLAASTVNLRGRVQLSEQLTAQAGHDLVRYTQENGRVTLPATITGPFSGPAVSIDAGDMIRRALTNRATEEARKRLKDIFGKQ